MQPRSWMNAAARSIVFLLQLGFSMLLPPLVCVAGALYAQEHWGWGDWVWPAAIGLGLVLGGSAFWEFARLMQREAARRDAARRSVGDILPPQKERR